jgi:beta-glucosidase-like glycosyl hydrolase
MSDDEGYYLFSRQQHRRQLAVKAECDAVLARVEEVFAKMEQAKKKQEMREKKKFKNLTQDGRRTLLLKFQSQRTWIELNLLTLEKDSEEEFKLQNLLMRINFRINFLIYL